MTRPLTLALLALLVVGCELPPLSEQCVDERGVWIYAGGAAVFAGWGFGKAIDAFTNWWFGSRKDGGK